MLGSPGAIRFVEVHSVLSTFTNAPYEVPVRRSKPCAGKAPVWQGAIAHLLVKIGCTFAEKLTGAGMLVVVLEVVVVEVVVVGRVLVLVDVVDVDVEVVVGGREVDVEVVLVLVVVGSDVVLVDVVLVLVVVGSEVVLVDVVDVDVDVLGGRDVVVVAIVVLVGRSVVVEVVVLAPGIWSLSTQRQVKTQCCPTSHGMPISHCSGPSGSSTPSPQYETCAENVFLMFAFRTTKVPIIESQSGENFACIRALPAMPTQAGHTALTRLRPIVLTFTGAHMPSIEILRPSITTASSPLAPSSSGPWPRIRNRPASEQPGMSAPAFVRSAHGRTAAAIAAAVAHTSQRPDGRFPDGSCLESDISVGVRCHPS